MYDYVWHDGQLGVWIEETFIPTMGGGKGGGGGGQASTVTSVVNVPPKSEQEQELDAINLELAKSQRDQLLISQARTDPAAAKAYLDEVAADPTKAGGRFKGLEAFDSPTFRTDLDTAAADTARTKKFDDLIYNQLYGRLTGTSFLTDAENTALDTLYGSAKATGEEDLTQYGQQIAAQRGMRTSDSPIGNEMVRERGRLALGLESAKASSKLDLSQGQKNFEESIRQFQEGLRNQGFQNRLALASAAPLSFNLASQLAGQRFQGISQTTSSKQSNTPGFGEIAGGIGGLLYGGAAAYKGFKG